MMRTPPQPSGLSFRALMVQPGGVISLSRCFGFSQLSVVHTMSGEYSSIIDQRLSTLLGRPCVLRVSTFMPLCACVGVESMGEDVRGCLCGLV